MGTKVARANQSLKIQAAKERTTRKNDNEKMDKTQARGRRAGRVSVDKFAKLFLILAFVVDFSVCDSTDSNANCTGCVGCRGCKNCVGCVNCVGCEGCTGCVDCVACKDCTGCQACYDCRDCLGCRGCEACEDCTQCFDSNHLKNCTSCNKSSELLDCQNCANSRGCRGKANLNNTICEYPADASRGDNSDDLEPWPTQAKAQSSKGSLDNLIRGGSQAQVSSTQS